MDRDSGAWEITLNGDRLISSIIIEKIKLEVSKISTPAIIAYQCVM